MREALRGTAAGLVAVGLTGGLSPLVSALSLLSPTAADPVLYWWAKQVLRASGVKSVAEGLEHLPAGNFVICANHQSNFDAVLLFHHLHRHIRFVAKKQLRDIPVFGAALARTGNIFIERDGGGGDRQKLAEAAEQVRSRVSVVFFAEGTRSEAGVLGPFKKGAAVMALAAQVPLVPVAIAGTHRILEKRSLVLRPRPAAICVGAPISTEGLGQDAREALTGRAHAEVERLLKRGNALISEMG